MEYSLTKFSAVLAAGLISGCASNPVYAQRCKLEAAQASASSFPQIRKDLSLSVGDPVGMKVL
jgi:hypothetical protein